MSADAPNADAQNAQAAEFVARWRTSGGGEIANSQSFLKELCQLLGLPEPDPTVPEESANRYVFEKAVKFNDGSDGRVDLYRADCFVLESKQGADRKAEEIRAALAETTRQKRFRTGTAQRGTAGWEKAMSAAARQAERYAKAIPNEWPPFLVVADVGHCFDLYADFTQSGKQYVPFPDPKSYRIRLEELQQPEVRDRLRLLWTDPRSLDPSRISAVVTRRLADKLAKLAKALEQEDASHTPERVAQFLMRCLFTMFAEDVNLIPEGSFRELLESLRDDVPNFRPMVEALWQTMDTGGFSPILRKKLLRFNGGLFENPEALPVTADQLELLIEAAEAQWREVEPAIFGTLLERALDPVERHKLGAHYTPRAYVERLVMPTLIEPLRDEWDSVQATAAKLDEDGKTADAVRTVREFHERLCETRVLDPACGSGNFLYVSLELMKRLEGEVLNRLREYGERQMPLLTVDPHQFLGIEVNPRAAAITDLVLWIGYLQWHFRTRGSEMTVPEPVIKKYDNIECRDAVLEWDSVEEVLDDDGNPVTRWDGRTTKPHPVTGEEVPDEGAQVTELRYVNPRPTAWWRESDPPPDYVVGNPPFIGTRRMRLALGDGYVDALADALPEVPKNADYVMYWWDKAGTLTRDGSVKRFGFITTNSITQSFNRATVARFLETKPPGNLWFSIPDHPWVDAADGASVRVAMTVGVAASDEDGTLMTVPKSVQPGAKHEDASAVLKGKGRITSDLRIGASPAAAVALKANASVSYWGTKFYGDGFIVTAEEAKDLEAKDGSRLARPFVSGRDVTRVRRGLWALDCDGLTEEELRDTYPASYQRLLDRVKPERAHNPRAFKREKWWIFGENQPGMRKSITDLPRYFATTETAKHRFFESFSADVLAEGTVAVIALGDAYFLGVLSSRIHVQWALAAGGRLGVGNDPRYNKTRCFETFPFPDADESMKQRIRDIGERLDLHRKERQSEHPKLTMTDTYNVLEKLRAGEELSDKERTIHEQGLVSVLRQIHDELEDAVADAYGWPRDLADEQILERLVALNAERAAEEAAGKIRWLRPEFQNPEGTTQPDLPGTEDDTPTKKPAKAAKPKKAPWPKTLPERFQAVQSVLQQSPTPLTAKETARHFTRAKTDSVAELLETLATLGQARITPDGRYAA